VEVEGVEDTLGFWLARFNDQPVEPVDNDPKVEGPLDQRRSDAWGVLADRGLHEELFDLSRFLLEEEIPDEQVAVLTPEQLADVVMERLPGVDAEVDDWDDNGEPSHASMYSRMRFEDALAIVTPVVMGTTYTRPRSVLIGRRTPRSRRTRRPGATRGSPRLDDPEPSPCDVTRAERRRA
jgi:hypothetical protein